MAEISQTDIKTFITLFEGRKDAFGCFTVTGHGEGGKLTGKASTVKSTLTDDIYVKHLKGEQGVGVIPIKNNNKCSFSVIDIDNYTSEIKLRTIHIIHAFNMPLTLFSSKSGGIHAYIFFKNEVTTRFARECLKKLRDLLGLPENTEIFPKQEKVDEGTLGNWINLPYFNAGADCNRNLLDEQGNPIKDLTLAMSQCAQRIFSEEEIKSFFENIPLQDAPPCLQQLYVTGKVTDRNNYLFSLGVYFKAKYGDDRAEKELIEANTKLSVKLSMSELMTTVIASMRKKDYSYRCEEPPLCGLCNPEECAKRKFGIGGKEVSKLSFGEFRQIMSDPPTYEWDVNGKSLILENEDDILNQNGFRKQCVRKLGVVPEKVSETRWHTMISRAVQNRKVIEVDPDTDVSNGAIIRTYIIDYIIKRSRLINKKEGIAKGYVYLDIDAHAYIFDPRRLVIYLAGKKELKNGLVASQFKEKIKELKASIIDYKINDEDSIKCYSVPQSSIGKIQQKISTAAEGADFLDAFAEGNTDF